MNKAKQATKQKLRQAYQTSCNSYLIELMRMWEWDSHYGYWIADEVGGVYAYADWIFIDMDDIIFCVENDVEEKEYEDWQEYCVFAQEYKQDTPNFPSWHKGCPRLSKEQQKKLITLKRNLNDCINDFKEQVKNG